MVTTEAEIRPLAPQEAEALADLARAIWLAHYPAIISLEQIEYMLAQRYRPGVIRSELAGGEVFWDTLWVDGAMAGFSSYFRAGTTGEMKLDKLYVRPDLQRRGHGGRLIARAARVAREGGCTRLVLAVNKRNAGAIAAYRKHGFAVVDSVVKDIGGGFAMDDYIMALDL
ncbi:MAG TPA: GNAT family N-acetyltransferase [Burkholderiales bacterium]|nr:GNAT family N-acetyltransferase [Burkholderiales bacterium]